MGRLIYIYILIYISVYIYIYILIYIYIYINRPIGIMVRVFAIAWKTGVQS